jgi:hypothetical protein
MDNAGDLPGSGSLCQNGTVSLRPNRPGVSRLGPGGSMSAHNASPPRSLSPLAGQFNPQKACAVIPRATLVKLIPVGAIVCP